MLLRACVKAEMKKIETQDKFEKEFRKCESIELKNEMIKSTFNKLILNKVSMNNMINADSLRTSSKNAVSKNAFL